MNREEKLEALAKVLSKSWFYGEWKWETPNERVMQMLMEDLGYYPYEDEDDMIKKSHIDEKLYIEALEKISTRPSHSKNLEKKQEGI